MTSNGVIRADTGFLVSVDLVVLSIVDDHLHVLVERRNEAPLRGRRALPRTFVKAGESLEAAASRLVAELEAPDGGPGHQLAAFGAPRRDPTGRVIGIGWLLLRPCTWKPPARHKWLPVAEATQSHLGFDHVTILETALTRLRDGLETTALATELCPEPFTLGQLRAVYEVVWGAELDAANFHRKFTSMPGLLEATGTLTSGSRGRPAMLYRQVGCDRLPVRFNRP